MKLNLFMCFFFLFCFWKTCERFFILFTYSSYFWFRYLQTCIKESCMYLSSQLKSPHKTLKFQEKSEKNAFYCNLQTCHGAIPQSHWTKQSVMKPNLWGKTTVDKSAWIKAWYIIDFTKIRYGWLVMYSLFILYSNRDSISPYFHFPLGIQEYNIYILFYDMQAAGLHTIQYWNIDKVVVILVKNTKKKKKLFT